MENAVNERIKDVIKNEGIRQDVFCSIIDVSIDTLRSAFRRGANPGFDLIHGIATKFPAYSLEWLIAGSGSMLKSTGSSSVNFSGQMSNGVFGANMGNVRVNSNDLFPSNDGYKDKYLDVLEENRKLSRRIDELRDKIDGMNRV
jgi:hypothetical protein